MTQVQCLIRYMKEKDMFGYAYMYLTNRYRALRPIGLDMLLLIIVRVFELKGHVFSLPNLRWIKDSIMENTLKFKYGDIFTVKTIDGKYEFDYKFNKYHDIDRDYILNEENKAFYIDRIIAINGEPIDAKNCWKLKDGYKERLL